MANFEVKIARQQFQRIGVRPSFDENLYGELLDEYDANTVGLVVRLAPHLSWGRNIFGQIGMALTRRDEYEIGGQYDGEATAIDVHCIADVEKTNGILLHETKHHIDHTTGEIEAGIQIMRRSAKRVLTGMTAGGLALAGAFAATDFADPIFGTLAVFPAAPLAYMAYWKAPHEVAARDFSKNLDVIEAYGRVITYAQA